MNFPARARAAIDRHVGRDQLTVRPGQRAAADLAYHLADAQLRRWRGDRAEPVLPAPSAALPLLP